MEQTIVIDHGDQGGARLIDGRIEPIPPLEPGLSAQLRAATALLRAAEQAEEEDAKRLGAFARETAAMAVGRLREKLGQAGGAVIVHGAGGGLVADPEEGGDEPHSLIRTIPWPGPWPWPPNPEEILRALWSERERELQQRFASWSDGERTAGLGG